MSKLQRSGRGHATSVVRPLRAERFPSSEINCLVVALWCSPRGSVYLARDLKALIVRHGAEPVDGDTYTRLAEVVTWTAQDTELRTVLIDYREAPTRCECTLCGHRASRTQPVTAAIALPHARGLSAGMHAFGSFKAAIQWVGPRKAEPLSVPCPLGFERKYDRLKAAGGRLVIGTYIGAIMELPRYRAVYLHWSGDDGSAETMEEMIRTVRDTAKVRGATHLIVDRRHRVPSASQLSRRISQRAADYAGFLERITFVGASPADREIIERFDAKMSVRFPHIKVEYVSTVADALRGLEHRRMEGRSRARLVA